MKRSLSAAARMLIVGFLPLLTGCDRGARVELHAAGHPITVRVAGNHSIDTKPTGAEVRSQYGTIRIERSRVQLDGLNWTAIPEDVPVHVGISKHKQWVTAGRVTIKQETK